MDGGRSARGSPKGPGPPSAPGRSWTQGQKSDRGPGGPAGAQPPFSLCCLSAPGQFRDPTQAGGRREAGTRVGAGVREWAQCQGRRKEGAEERRWVEQGQVEEEAG